MEQETRVLARRHMWLSWWWGMWVVWAIGLLWVTYLWVASHSGSSTPAQFLTEIGYGFVGAMVFLGLPALLGVLVRRPIMQRVFGRATSLAGLLWRTALVFEGFVLVCWLLWELYSWIFTPLSIRVLPRQHFATTTLTFFGLSLPWLLSSVAAAWWLNRGRWRAVKIPKHEPVSN